MNFQGSCERWNALHARISSILIAVRSVVRGLPLLMAGRPNTPLRVLCVMAFDTLHRIRTAKPLPMFKVRLLSALLDFGACANAAFDNKDCCRHEYQETLQLLEESGIRSSVVEYLRRLQDVESNRPLPGGDYRRFQSVGLYRETVVRLSLGMVATTANRNHCLDEGIRATYCDADLNILFRIVMQCQIIDDVLDCSRDLSAGLPGFLTASRSLAEAYELTRLAAREYADVRDVPKGADLFPLQSALSLVSLCAKLVLVAGRISHRMAGVRRATPRIAGPAIAQQHFAF